MYQLSVAVMKIAIATTGRFHLLDLARELRALGHEVRLYSYIPRRRARRYGLPDECHVSLLPFVSFFLVWEKLAPRALSGLRECLFYKVVNWAVSVRLGPCDVFVCMSGIYLEAARRAKRDFHARIWLERGSQHILAQDKILSAVHGARRPSKLVISRELDGYRIADRIVVPSGHAEKSFQLYDESLARKIFRNPYGVELGMFPAPKKEKSMEPMVILFAGTWCMRKGSDILVQAVNRVSNVRVVHVGAIDDYLFPQGDVQFEHVDPVPQIQLARFYAAADIFVLPSREDGLGLVLPQALASGLPVICTDRTGGEDLAHSPALAARITVVASGDVEALERALIMWRDRYRAGGWLPPLSERDREMLSWSNYALRYSVELIKSIPRHEKSDALDLVNV